MFPKVAAIKKMISTNHFWFLKKAQAGARGKDCNFVAQGLAMALCDAHCIRDATIRGDQTINQNLEALGAVVQQNAKKAQYWATDTMNQQVEWLGKKIEYIDARQERWHTIDVMTKLQNAVRNRQKVEKNIVMLWNAAGLS